MPAPILIHAGTARAEHYRRILETLPYQVASTDDTPETLVEMGMLLPRLIVLDARRLGAELVSIMQRVAFDPRFGHTRVLAETDLGHEHVSARTGLRSRLSVVPPGVSSSAFLSLAVQLCEVCAPEDFHRLTPPSPPGYPLPANEAERLLAVTRAGVLDTEHEGCFDDLVWMAATVLEMPIALITVLTPTRQWFKARHGIGLTETPRSQAFCNYTLLQHDVFVVEDAIVDGRFRDNPLVTGEPHIRFYAGVPVHDADGHRLGGLCVIDRVARAFDARQRRQLSVLGEAVSEKIRLRLVDRRAKWMGATL